MASNLPPGVTDAMINEQCETNCPHCGGDLEEELSLYLDPLENEIAAKDARIAELECDLKGMKFTSWLAQRKLKVLRTAIEKLAILKALEDRERRWDQSLEPEEVGVPCPDLLDVSVTVGHLRELRALLGEGK